MQVLNQEIILWHDVHKKIFWCFQQLEVHDTLKNEIVK